MQVTLAASPTNQLNLVMATYNSVVGSSANLQASVVVQNPDPCLATSGSTTVGSSSLSVLLSPTNTCGNSLSTGAIVGIAVGCAAAVALIVGVILAVALKGRNDEKKKTFNKIEKALN